MPLFLQERLKRTSYIKCFCQRSLLFFFCNRKNEKTVEDKKFPWLTRRVKRKGNSFLKKEKQKKDRKSEESSVKAVSAQDQTGFATGWVPPAGRVGRRWGRRLCGFLFLLHRLFWKINTDGQWLGY